MVLDFFVAAPGLGAARRSAELVPIPVDFGDTTQVFNIGAASCGVPGVPAGLAEAARRFGSMPLATAADSDWPLARRSKPNRVFVSSTQNPTPTSTARTTRAHTWPSRGSYGV